MSVGAVEPQTRGRSARRATAVLRRRWWIPVLCMLVGGCIAFGLSKSQSKKYTATAAILFNDQSIAQDLSGLTTAQSNNPLGDLATDLLLVQEGMATADRAAARLNDGITASQIKGALSITEQGEANIVFVSATWTNPQMAARIATAYAKSFVSSKQNADRATIDSAMTLVRQQYDALPHAERRGPDGQTLLDHIESLSVLRTTDNTVQLSQKAVPPGTPSSPNVTRDTILGLLAGLVIGLILAFQIDRFDRRFRSTDEVQDVFGFPILGVIPHDVDLPSSSSGAGSEPFRMLRAHLRYFDVDKSISVLLVSSAQAGEGKTTVASGIALAAAEMGASALLIECDLRRPALASRLGLREGAGLTSALIDPENLQDVIQRVGATASEPLADAEGQRNGKAIAVASPIASRQLDVIPAGVIPPNPGELLESHAMERVLHWARETYDLTVIDTPPLTMIPDAIPLLERVDGVALVARLAHSERDVASRLRGQIDNFHAPVLGVVVNDLRGSGSRYYDYYD